MDAELTAILQNIKSLADQASQMQGGGEAPAGAPVEMAEDKLPPEVAEKVLKYLKEMDKEPVEEGDDDSVEKSDDEDEDDIKKSANGPTADDSAEARIDETTGEVNDKNINEVAKAIARMLVKKSSGKKTVQKSQSTGVGELTKVVKMLVDEVKVQKEFNVNVLKGLGIADSIIASEKENSQKSKPAEVSPQEVAKSLAYIQGILGTAPKAGNEVAPGTNGTDHFIAKSLSEGDGSLLMGMFPKSKR